MNEQVLHFSTAGDPTLQVSARTEGEITRYQFRGTVDAQARSVLEELGQTPPRTPTAVLDFAEVERINSMGLALLLKLLNVWEKTDVHIRIVNLNRMAAILFKITGLGRFLEGTAPDPANPPGNVAVTETKAVPPPPQREKLRFFAHLQTSQQLNGWYLFNTYLQRQLQQGIQFTSRTLAERDADDVEPADLVFSAPFETCRLVRRHRFRVLARPTGETDEVVILGHSDDGRPLDRVPHPKVAVSSKQSFIYLLGRFLCDEQGLDSSSFQFFETGNDIKAIQFLIRKRVDWVMMSRKTFEGLSSLSRRQLRVLDQSQTELAAYFFCAAPYLDDALRRNLQTVLTGMPDDDKGARILRDLELQGWEEPEPAELDLILKVYDAYAG